jgi:hypothetical protein
MLRSILAGAALLLLAACSTVGGTPQSPAQAVFQAKGAFASALVAANAYNALPRCEKPAAPVICARQDIVALMRKTAATADATLDSAEATVRTPGIDADALRFAIVAAQNATQALVKIVAQFAPGKEA